MISFFRASVQRLKIEAPARLMIQVTLRHCRHPRYLWLGSPVTRPYRPGAGQGRARRVRMVMARPARVSSRDTEAPTKPVPPVINTFMLVALAFSRARD